MGKFSDDDTVVLCMRVDRAPANTMVPGSVEVPCDGCGEKVWLSPDGQAWRPKNPSAKVGCAVCLDKDGGVHCFGPPVSPESLLALVAAADDPEAMAARFVRALQNPAVTINKLAHGEDAGA